MEHNPYAAPISDAAPSPPGVLEEDRLLTPDIIEAMSQTRPWVVFLSILGFIGAGLLVLVGFALLVFGGFANIGSGEAGVISVVYIVMAIFYVFPSLYLYRYGASIKSMQEGYGVHALTEALRQQKSFWRLVGISMLVVMCLYGVFFVLGLLFAISR